MGNFPALITTATTRTIEGDVWEITQDTLDRLDAYEGYPHLYTRETVVTEAGHSVIVYVFNRFVESWNYPGGWTPRIQYHNQVVKEIL